MLAARSISKRFGRTIALAGIDFSAHEGEIHALVGENGAGKSTLINIFAGRLRPNDGQVTLDGATVRAGSAAAALAQGIAAVFQSPMLFERMAWEENLALGGFKSEHFDISTVVNSAAALADELGFALPPPGAVVEARSVAERVRLEILRALSFRPRVLILDEPTSVLAPAELEPFLRLLRRLRSQRRMVILVTHKLAEALAVADRVTVLRSGRVAGERMAALTNETELAQLMMGHAELPAFTPVLSVSPVAPVVELDHITLKAKGRLILDDVSLTLRSGSLVGIAGVDGNGQDELVAVMAGACTPTSGCLRLHDREGGAGDDLAVIPQNRDLDGLILDLSLWENLLLSRKLRKWLGARNGWIRRSLAARRCRELLERFHVQASGPVASARSLSGGNRQRLVVARALASAPRALVAHDICRGLDLNATAELRRRLLDYVAGGGAVLLISSDLDELLTLCHRLYVIRRGHLTEVPPERHNPVEIGLLMSGSPP